MQVGLRSENIMITHPEGGAYRSSLSHASTTSPDQWTPSRSSSTSNPGVPPPREPATSARGAPPSVFRHHSTGSHPATATATAHVHATLPYPSSHPIPLEGPSMVSSSPLPPSGSLGSTSSSTSSSFAASDPQTLSPTRSKRASEEIPPVKLRNLNHVVELVQDERAQQASRRRNRSGHDDTRRYEISNMPVVDVIEMVAALLTKITITNDRQHMHRNMVPLGDGSLGNNANTTSSVLAFHGKNVPSITIMSYLSRIHKYCPTTYEVFLSLLVYFDRMTDRVNKKNSQQSVSPGNSEKPVATASTPPSVESSSSNPSHVFIVDSFNIHRLVIAGVTCASKFFSDVFYTNSRYAKVIVLCQYLVYVLILIADVGRRSTFNRT
jgi:hypothetical protein